MPRNKNHDSISNHSTNYKAIEGYDYPYYITDDGRVWSDSRKNGIERFLKPIKSKDGYLFVNLYKNGKPKVMRVHRLVAQAFIENPDNKPYVNHIDGNRTNNAANNLEWCTQQENVRHAIYTLNHWSNSEIQRKVARDIGIKNRKLSMDEARDIRRLYKSGGYSQRDLSKMFGLSRPCVRKIILNESYREVV